MTTLPSRTITVSINRASEVVAAFIRDPRNLPAWAEGLGSSVRHEQGEWFVTAPAGEVRVRFAEPNPFGVIDHWVRLSPETEIHIPMRVLPSGAGCEVSLTLFQFATMSDEQFAADQRMVEGDLHRLKAILEGNSNA